LVLACAVLASYLLVRVVDEPRRRFWVGYGCAVAVLGLLNLFGLLLLAGHAVFLLAGHRGLLRRWLTVAAPACLPALPVVVLAWRQRDQLGWLTAPGATAPGELTAWLAGSTGSVVLVSVLIGLGLRSRSGAAAAWLTLPWLIAPPVLLIAAAEIAMPVYVDRYVAYCLPALALAVGVGLAGITLAPRVIALLLIAGLGLPTQLAQRQADGHGDDIRAAATALAQHEQPGDGVLYDCPTCHYPDMPREFASGYPAAFGGLDDLALAGSPSASGTLRGTETDQATLIRRLDGANRVWLVETGGSGVPRPLADSGLHRVVSYPAGDVSVSLYQR
jgi:mannosyltransferase